MNVPEQVSKLAARYGFNSVSAVKQSVNETIYSAGRVDKTGFALPVGLPSFIIFNGETCMMVDGEDGLKLHDDLFGNE